MTTYILIYFESVINNFDDLSSELGFSLVCVTITLNLDEKTGIVIMKTMHLSPRLNAVLHMLPKGKCLADIGSDHAHLPCRAIQEGLCETAIAGEVRVGPYRQSVDNIETLGFSHCIDVRLGDGLDVLHPDEADTIVIAGMGGELIADILERGREKLGTTTTLILQPNIREPRVREWLSQNGWSIIDETIVEETPHFYEIIRAEQCPDWQKLSDLELQFGPILSKKKQTAFVKKWRRREHSLAAILIALKHAEQTDSVRKKTAECEKEWTMIQYCLTVETDQEGSD
ncbi:class I SAM-dependent methyltransferase [Sporolactobacillus sp. CPB3-1]|uniref:Class I SAM-dependent methyltransferase n=1 Tax=Sporolactobacillus mangiferae TaxID=2940498 RepID=A0ABT0M6A9_9BACL|nr:class I SAM-dependent methyltransferase [Sporolactobacillus mangiferae]MCL1630402.1 class I SAM-dependent methyltransferase [Sporolactobacillus mangiferae]